MEIAEILQILKEAKTKEIRTNIEEIDVMVNDMKENIVKIKALLEELRRGYAKKDKDSL